MHRKQIFFSACLILGLLMAQRGASQARMVLNGAKINLTNGARLVIQNPSPTAINRQSGHLISEGQDNVVMWMIGETAGTYLVPWGMGNDRYLPLTFTTSAATGAGSFVLSTYQTGWENGAMLPTQVLNMVTDGSDQSAFLLDRFWQIRAQEYTQKPTLQNLVFSYLEEEHTTPDNTITEISLQAQRWNEDLAKWGDLAPIGTNDPEANTVTIASLAAEDLQPWWVLVDANTPLPLAFLGFGGGYNKKQVLLWWETAYETDVQTFEIQRSPNLTEFKPVGSVAARGGSTKNRYSFTDSALPLSEMYYRIRAVDQDGSSSFTKTIRVDVLSAPSLQAFPNPVRNRTIFLKGGGIRAGDYVLTLHDLQGRLIQTTQLDFNRSEVAVSVNGRVGSGLYLLRVTNGQDTYQQKIKIE